MNCPCMSACDHLPDNRVLPRFGRLRVTEDRLIDYITERDFGKQLSAKEVGEIAQAFLGLAHMDKEFGRETKPKTVHKPFMMQPAGAD